jgi:putative PIG3 family NAD(P)H quinone oxidoreductase
MAVVPAHMRQVYFDGAGGPEVVRIGAAPVPKLSSGKVLIEVVAAGVNRPDCAQRAGSYPPPPGETDIPGLEVAGHICAVGEGVTALKVGDAVCALVGSGGYAEFALADAALCLPVPKALSVAESAGIPENYFTVYDNVFTRGRLKAGETILIHGGSSGIGSTAIQLAKAFGATVIATAGSDDKCHFCRTIGADHTVNYRAKDFVVEVKQMTDNRGVDVVLDMVGGSYLPKNVSLMAVEGRLVQIAFLESPKVESFNFLPVMVRRLTLTGSTLRPRPIALKAEIAQKLRDTVWPLLDQGTVKPIVHATFPLEDAHQAHALMESSGHLGKILLLTGT